MNSEHKQLLLNVAALLAIGGVLFVLAAPRRESTELPGGSRCPSGYIQLRTPTDVKKISDNMSGSYVLCNDIDMLQEQITPFGWVSESTKTTNKGAGMVIADR